MAPLIYILISMVIAACIGGITNHLAIKMLFHPREKKFIAGKSIPFTPGLIPKRKEEISRSLGKVVGDYLVTSEGLSVLLNKPEFRQKIERKLALWIEEWSEKEETIEEWALRFWSTEEIKLFQERLLIWLQNSSAHGASWLWERQNQSALTLKQLIPDWSEDMKEKFVEWIIQYLTQEIKEALRSTSGDRLLRQLSQQVMEHAGGLFGTLAGIFMDEDKIVNKAKHIIDDQIQSPRVKRLMREFLHAKFGEWENKTVSEVIEKIADGDSKHWFIEKIESVLKWEDWLKSLNELKLKQLFSPVKPWMITQIPTSTGLLLRIVISNVDRMVVAIDLPKLVEEQVQHFPIDRLEQIILSVSGREFKAITWLGALLGGLIGLFQASMLLWYL